MPQHFQLMVDNRSSSGKIWREPAAGEDEEYAAGSRLADKKTAAQGEVADWDDVSSRSETFPRVDHPSGDN